MKSILNYNCTDYERLMCLALSCKHSENKKQEFKTLFSKIDEKLLYNVSSIDEVSSHIAFYIEKYKLNPTIDWNTSKREVKTRIDTLMHELDKVANIFLKNNIRLAALKNAGITRGIFHNTACSPMGDIDLLIQKDDFLAGHDLLMNQCGYTFKFRSELENENIEEAILHGGTEYFKEINNQTVWLELQWRPIAGRWIQPFLEPKSEDLISRSYTINGSDIRILSPEDNLIQVCLHTAKHSYTRAPGFRLHSDVDRISTLITIDWKLFLANTKKLNVKTGIYYSLLLAKKLLDSPIPKDILLSLKPGILKDFLINRLILNAGIFNQKKKKFNKLNYIIFNLLLYDSISDAIKAIFPPINTFKSQEKKYHSLFLPFYYIKRILQLIFFRSQL